MFRIIIVFTTGLLAGAFIKKDTLKAFKDAAEKSAEDIAESAKTNAEKVKNVVRKSASAVKEEFFPEKEGEKTESDAAVSTPEPASE